MVIYAKWFQGPKGYLAKRFCSFFVIDYTYSQFEHQVEHQNGPIHLVALLLTAAGSTLAVLSAFCIEFLAAVTATQQEFGQLWVVFFGTYLAISSALRIELLVVVAATMAISSVSELSSG